MLNKELTPTLLLLSERPFYTTFLRRILGKEFVVYPLGIQGVTLAGLPKITFDLILIDDHECKEGILPLLEALKCSSDFSCLPIIILTKSLKRSYREQILKIGVTDILQEPLDEDEVREKFAQAVATKGRFCRLDTVLEEHHPSSLQGRTLIPTQAIRALDQIIKKGEMLSMLAIALDDEGVDYNNVHNILKKVVLTNDFYLSLGSGKYLLILKVTPEEAYLLAERLQKALPLLSIGIIGQKIPPFGGFAEMLICAKEALQEAEQKGHAIVKI